MTEDAQHNPPGQCFPTRGVGEPTGFTPICIWGQRILGGNCSLGSTVPDSTQTMLIAASMLPLNDLLLAAGSGGSMSSYAPGIVNLRASVGVSFRLLSFRLRTAPSQRAGAPAAAGGANSPIPHSDMIDNRKPLRSPDYYLFIYLVVPPPTWLEKVPPRATARVARV